MLCLYQFAENFQSAACRKACGTIANAGDKVFSLPAL